MRNLTGKTERDTSAVDTHQSESPIAKIAMIAKIAIIERQKRIVQRLDNQLARELRNSVNCLIQRARLLLRRWLRFLRAGWCCPGRLLSSRGCGKTQILHGPIRLPVPRPVTAEGSICLERISEQQILPLRKARYGSLFLAQSAFSTPLAAQFREGKSVEPAAPLRARFFASAPCAFPPLWPDVAQCGGQSRG